MSLHSTRRGVVLAATISVGALALTACSGGGGGGSAAPTEFTVLSNVENTVVPAVLKSLSENQCADANTALPLKVDTVPQASLDQQLQLLAGQGGLPVMFAAGGAPALTKTLAESGNVADFSEVLPELGVEDDIQPSAVSTIEALYGGFRVLPTEFNIEGIWYNKAYFDQYGIETPTTWTELVAAAKTLQDNGVQAFSASGEQGWPLTRLLGNYLFRTVGDDAMDKVIDGSAKLTDPEYVDAATAVADLGAAGYFGEGVGSIDYDTSINEFLNGNAGMLYMGSWVLSNFADEANNTIGSDNIAFMPFPEVEGGAGTQDALAANVGLPFTFNAKTVEDKKVKAWLKCIVENFGSVALEEQSRVTGFVLADPVEVDPLTQEVQDRIADAGESILWFEALFDSKALTDSTSNAAPLVTGATSPTDFMALIQSDLG